MAAKTQAHEHGCGPEGGEAKPAFSLLPFIGVKRGTAHGRDFRKRRVPANARPRVCASQSLPLLRESLPQTTTFPTVLVLGRVKHVRAVLSPLPQSVSDRRLHHSIQNCRLRVSSEQSALAWSLASVSQNWASLGGSDSKESACNAGDLGWDPWVGKILWRTAWQLTPVSLPGESHGRRSLTGYSPWDHKELDTTEHVPILT